MVVKEAHISTNTSEAESLNPDLSELISLCLENNRLAQAQLYKQFHGKLMGLCMRYFTNRDDALCALNQGFLKIFKNLDRYNFQHDFAGWAHRIVQYTAIDLLRKQVKLQNIEYINHDFEHESNEITVSQKLNTEDLLKLLQKLPEISRLVFNLFAIEGYKHHEIAEQLSISVGTSKWHVNHARKILKESLLKMI
ncbi:MAG: RNA polymerase sigma-70 factor (ECF subfamily) [Bacteroidia bacterium]|jgi:RNA polymerase sigma-70 factor (ECF subfamily)